MEYEEVREEFDFGYILVGLALVLGLLYFTGVIGGDSKAQDVQDEVKDDRQTPWTLDEIRKFDGKGPDGKIYIGCNGFVFDVTESPNFQEGGGYANFAGYDISIACANYSTDDKHLG